MKTATCVLSVKDKSMVPYVRGIMIDSAVKSGICNLKVEGNMTLTIYNDSDSILSKAISELKTAGSKIQDKVSMVAS